MININLPFLKKSKVGISISSDSIIVVEIEKNGDEYRLKDFKSADIKGLLKPSLTELNIINTEVFKKTAAVLISRKNIYASVSIPDICVKTKLLEFESLPQKKSEIEKLIKWKIERSIPFPVDDARLSYQLLNKREEGKGKILVSIIKKAVLIQYEDVLKECSVEPILIDSSSFHIFNLYHNFIMRDSSNQSFIFLDLRDDIFAMMIFKKGAPDFIRIKPVKVNREIKRIKDELHASLKFYSHSAEISDLEAIYYIADIEIDKKLLFEDMDMQIKRLGINQMPWLNPPFPVAMLRSNGSPAPLLKGGVLPAIGAAMER